MQYLIEQGEENAEGGAVEGKERVGQGGEGRGGEEEEK